MAVVAFQGCFGTGHGGYPPRQSTGGDSTFLINGVAVHRETDAWGQHCSGSDCHVSVLQSGSSTFLANGLQVGRIADPVACGSIVAEGDPTFLVDD